MVSFGCGCRLKLVWFCAISRRYKMTRYFGCLILFVRGDWSSWRRTWPVPSPRSRRRNGQGIGRKKEGDWWERVRDACYKNLLLFIAADAGSLPFSPLSRFFLSPTPSPFCTCHACYPSPATCKQTSPDFVLYFLKMVSDFPNTNIILFCEM